MPGLIAVLMGVMTAVFGGVLRDIVCNEIPLPSVITARTLFARSSVAGSSLPSTVWRRCRRLHWPSAGCWPPCYVCWPSAWTGHCRAGGWR